MSCTYDSFLLKYCILFLYYCPKFAFNLTKPAVTKYLAVVAHRDDERGARGCCHSLSICRLTGRISPFVPWSIHISAFHTTNVRLPHHDYSLRLSCATRKRSALQLTSVGLLRLMVLESQKIIQNSNYYYPLLSLFRRSNAFRVMI